MNRTAWAHEIRAFTNYRSADNSIGATSTAGGVTFKNGLYISGAGFAPKTLSVSSTNSSDASGHSHAITTSSNPGAAASILATDSAGHIILRTLDIGGSLLGAVTGYNTDIGQLTKKFRALHAAELWVETLVAQNTIATIGGRVLVGPTTLLIANLVAAATTIDVKHNQMSNGDRVYMEADGSVEFMAITSGPTVISGGYRYSVTRDLDGTGANDWSAGDAVFNTGTTGNGFIDLYSVQAVKGGSQIGPTIVGNVRNSATYNDWSEHWAIGNLYGLYGYGAATTYGAAFGKYASGHANITLDATNGLRMRNFTTVVAQLDTSGDLILGAAASNNIQLDNAGFIKFRIGSTIIADWTGSNISLGRDTAGQSNIRINASLGSVKLRNSTTDVLTLDTTDGLQIFGSGVSLIQFDTSGNARFGRVAASKANVFWNASNSRLEFRGNTTVQAYIDVDGSFVTGAGKVKLNTDGLVFTVPSAFEVATAIQWRESSLLTGSLYNFYSGTSVIETVLLSQARAADTAAASVIRQKAISHNGSEGIFSLAVGGSTHGFYPNQVAAHMYGTGSASFLGLVLGATSAPTNMLDVYGTGWFQGALTCAAGIVQDSWTAPTLLNSWVNFGGSTQVAGYMKDSMGFVHLRGVVKDGTTSAGTIVLTLPSGYRPTAEEYFMVSSAGAAFGVFVDSSGNVKLNGTAGSNLSLNGIIFRAS